MTRIIMHKADCVGMIRKIGKLFYGFAIVFLVVIAVAVSMSAFKLPGGFRLFTVQSGSMVPALKTGSIVIDRSKSSYQKGDMITFLDVEKPKVTITHRIVEVKKDNDLIKYITKGDANDANDSGEINKSSVIGKVLLTIPYLGYPVAFAKTQTGFMLLIVIPATILVYSEMMSIKKELSEILKRRNEEKGKRDNKKTKKKTIRTIKK